MKKLDIVDFLKGFSMLTIVLYHYFNKIELPDYLLVATRFGGTGVHLFVFLSGFGLYLSYLRKPISYLAFLKRRMSKVYLPYIIVVSISALLALIIPIYDKSWYAYAGHLLLFKMFDESIVGSYGYPLWFISMILQFYLSFPLIVWLRKTTNAKLFLILALLVSLSWSGLVFYLGNEALRIWNSFFLQYLWEFALGFLAAEYIQRNNYQLKLNIKAWQSLSLGVLSCLVYAAAALKGGDKAMLFNDIPAFAGYTLLAIWLYQVANSTIKNFLIFTGEVSYSLFLLHVLCLMIALQFKEDLNIILLLCLALFSSYGLAFYYQKFVLRIYRFLGI
jgi:peptidoglycan/LPS O-acetylase OafA/YrhL